jgi:hypothetical protein
MSTGFGELVMTSTEYAAVERGCCVNKSSAARVKI